MYNTLPFGRSVCDSVSPANRIDRRCHYGMCCDIQSQSAGWYAIHHASNTRKHKFHSILSMTSRLGGPRSTCSTSHLGRPAAKKRCLWPEEQPSDQSHSLHSMDSMHRDSNEVGSHLGLHRLATGKVTIPSGLLLCSIKYSLQRYRAVAEHR